LHSRIAAVRVALRSVGWVKQPSVTLRCRWSQVAILWEGDDGKDVRRITYKELLREVSRLANVLKRMGAS
jgi:acyl-coenzyme A synthetase/AMP-(fatty) acid ligase